MMMPAFKKRKVTKAKEMLAVPHLMRAAVQARIPMMKTKVVVEENDAKQENGNEKVIKLVLRNEAEKVKAKNANLVKNAVHEKSNEVGHHVHVHRLLEPPLEERKRANQKQKEKVRERLSVLQKVRDALLVNVK